MFPYKKEMYMQFSFILFTATFHESCKYYHCIIEQNICIVNYVKVE